MLTPTCGPTIVHKHFYAFGVLSFSKLKVTVTKKFSWSQQLWVVQDALCLFQQLLYILVKSQTTTILIVGFG